mmetsp:Transcript_59085/g.97694  ORF Transcript_59085/g.97694 Transcript_59085/m.97694 type:complete len:247 (-) Transcript_59085:351-1091(-)|eukprot:CAMPEP_0202688564 /NCGR_PEP_ID=MMETSP1385-20130828/4055_1 /ASSEMBLY_ACC=CAM_ASM_000861 /TAXON_ID=933848 /ORGANISM="Elphidium margaritaceum" /LENGTH=246 /DNA_ID=CAMNT_0049343561 /DNA_START=82 /DNA_END=822 /DNA_ORIENTATION=+
MSSALVDSLGEDVSKVVELVRIAETAERYEDMCVYVKKLVKLKSAKKEDLDVDERNLLSVAYKNVVGQARSSWRTLNAGFDEVDQDMITKYKALIEKQLEDICTEIIDLLKDNLIVTVKGNGDETEVFYLKMAGDYFRYMAEFNDDEKFKKGAEEFYRSAMDVAEANLKETHPTRLGLALNFSVCYYEILKKPQEACELAKKSFDAAIEKLDTLNDASYKDSTLIMQLLRDNLTLWTSAEDDQEQE